jgi:sulfoxide reductase catalytic subunit YedY
MITGKLVAASVFISFVVLSTAIADNKLKPDTPKKLIVQMDPMSVDASDYPLDAVEDLHGTSAPPLVEIGFWRLAVGGPAVRTPLALTDAEIQAMPAVKDAPILICPGVFVDHAEWEGVTLAAVIDMAKVKATWSTVTFEALDGYRTSFTWQEVDAHLFYLAYKVNGQVLPLLHGYPLRLVAEDFFGGRWVKWLRESTVG